MAALTVEAALTVTIIAALTALTIEAALTVTIITALTALTVEAALAVTVITALTALTVEAALTITIVLSLAALTIEAALTVAVVLSLAALTVEAALAVAIVLSLAALTRRTIPGSSGSTASHLSLAVCGLIALLRTIFLNRRRCRRCGSYRCRRLILLRYRHFRRNVHCGSLLHGSYVYLRLFLLLRHGIHALRLLNVPRNHLHAGRGRRRGQRLDGRAGRLLLRSAIIISLIAKTRSAIVSTLRASLLRGRAGALTLLASGILLIVDNDDGFLLLGHCRLCISLCRLCCILRRSLRLLCLGCGCTFLCLGCLLLGSNFHRLFRLCFLCILCLRCRLSLLCIVGTLLLRAAKGCPHHLLLLGIEATGCRLPLDSFSGKELQQLFILHL